MSDFVTKIDSPVKYAALAVFLFYLFINHLVKTKVSGFGERASVFVTVFSTIIFSGLIFLGLALVFSFDFLKYYPAKADKAAFPIQINLNKLPAPNTYSKTKPNNVFIQRIMPEKRNSDNYINYSYSVPLEEGKPHYNSDSGLEFTANDIDVEKGTAKIEIGPSEIAADSLKSMKDGGISYHTGGKICTIYLVNAHSIGDKNYITLRIQQ